MNKYIVLFYLQLITFYSSSQPCYDFFEDAQYLSQFDAYKSLADSILDVEISRETKNFNVYLLKSKLLYQKGKETTGFKFLLEAVKYGCNTHHHIFTNKFFKKVITKSDSLKIINASQYDVEIPYNASNKLTLTQLYQLVHWDQALNNFTIRFRDSMCISSSQSRVLELKITRTMLRDYLQKFGFPDEKEFGSEMVDRFDLVVIHHFQLVDSCEWLKPFYDTAYKNNKINPHRYYNYYDNLLVYKNLHQKYGTFTGGKQNNSRYEIYPIENMEKIDELRERLCLSPLHVFLKNNRFDIPYDYDYDLLSYVETVRRRLIDKK